MGGPTGGTITVDGLYTVNTFTSSGTFTSDKSIQFVLVDE